MNEAILRDNFMNYEDSVEREIEQRKKRTKYSAILGGVIGVLFIGSIFVISVI